MNRELDTLIQSKRIPHALALDGGTYDSRLALARTVAASLICSDDTVAGPCRHCTACNKVFSDIHPDVITVLPDKKKKTLSVDVIRDMREDVSVLPNESEHKVYIIAKAELMQDYAQNALLKLEDNKAALDIAKRMALCIADRDEFALMACVSFFEKNYELLKPALERLSLILRDALVLLCGGKTVISSAESEARRLASLPKDTLLKALSGLEEIQKSINIYGNKNLILCRLSSKLIGGNND